MIRKFSILMILLSLAGAISHATGGALPSLRWFFGLSELTGYVVMALAFLVGLFLLVRGPKDIHWTPMTLRKFQRFKSIRRGHLSLLILIGLVFIAMLDQAIVGKRALIVNYDGEWYFPAFKQGQYKAVDFGGSENSEADYRQLKQSWKDSGSDNWVLMPLVPWGPVLDSQELLKVELEQRNDGKYYLVGKENPYSGNAYTYYSADETQRHTMFRFRQGLQKGRGEGFAINGDRAVKEQWAAGERISREFFGEMDAATFDTVEVTPITVVLYPPLAPNLKNRHFLGTDTNGWDIAATIFGGFQVVLKAALLYLTVSYAVGLTIGCLMGYLGGKFDIVTQRFIEVLANIPFLYVVMIINNRLDPDQRTIGVIVGVMCIFSWIGMTFYMRTATYREKSRDYVAASKLLGASTPRMIFGHIIPNSISTIVTLIPFSFAGVTASLTALDFIGFGLPEKYPSWGRTLSNGVENLDAPWIVISVFAGMVTILLLVTFVGEAIREAFDPKKFTYYK
jgi:microcin C transport system permease protein